LIFTQVFAIFLGLRFFPSLISPPKCWNYRQEPLHPHKYTF
jgi:hypothetical protein